MWLDWVVSETISAWVVLLVVMLRRLYALLLRFIDKSSHVLLIYYDTITFHDYLFVVNWQGGAVAVLLPCIDKLSHLRLIDCCLIMYSLGVQHNSYSEVNSPVLQSARPRAVALASYTRVDKIIKSTVGFTRKDIWID